MATAHVARHVFGSAWYALKAVAAADPAEAWPRVAGERDWQSRRLPERRRQPVMDRIVIVPRGKVLLIRIDTREGG